MAAHGPDKLDATLGSELTATAVYRNGEYRVVLKRARLEGRRAAIVRPGCVHAGRFPGVGRRHRRDRLKDVP
jgi:hypothetical protein